LRDVWILTQTAAVASKLAYQLSQATHLPLSHPCTYLATHLPIWPTISLLVIHQLHSHTPPNTATHLPFSHPSPYLANHLPLSQPSPFLATHLQRWASTLANRSNARHRSNIRAPPRPLPPECGNLCGQRCRKRFIASLGLRMSYICPCTPCPSPPG
jgi:hypothetical protein